MADTNRRDLMAGLAAFALAGAGYGQQTSAAGGDFAAGSRVFSGSTMPRTKSANGAERLVVLDGRLPTGEAVQMHESWVPPGTPAPALHVIHHSELIFVVEGTLEFLHDGASSFAHAGDVIYVAFGTNHAVHNAGPGTARYVVWQMGGDTQGQGTGAHVTPVRSLTAPG